MQILSMESAKDSENKPFSDSRYAKVGLTVGGLVVGVLAFVGGKAAIEGAAKRRLTVASRPWPKVAPRRSMGWAKRSPSSRRV
ncbi:MAG: hypothetical protein B7C54_00205 [Acidimicrobiales bacterium mtb01]|nr:MAG: hypothetical protein B7C54_00205 [Acidimicrobiales bacterium mtb01]